MVDVHNVQTTKSLLSPLGCPEKVLEHDSLFLELLRQIHNLYRDHQTHQCQKRRTNRVHRSD